MKITADQMRNKTVGVEQHIVDSSSNEMIELIETALMNHSSNRKYIIVNTPYEFTKFASNVILVIKNHVCTELAKKGFSAEYVPFQEGDYRELMDYGIAAHFVIKW